jgi:hypothetical protein
VLGYPLGFSDELNNLPIVRRASIASAFDVDFEAMPCFLVDAQLHEGMSGSPVFAHAQDAFDTKTGALHIVDKPTSYFLGVFSDEWTVDKQPLRLNTVWRVSVIRDILRMQT